jgi:hypothetical protein
MRRWDATRTRAPSKKIQGKPRKSPCISLDSVGRIGAFQRVTGEKIKKISLPFSSPLWLRARCRNLSLLSIRPRSWQNPSAIRWSSSSSVKIIVGDSVSGNKMSNDLCIPWSGDGLSASGSRQRVAPTLPVEQGSAVIDARNSRSPFEDLRPRERHALSRRVNSLSSRPPARLPCAGPRRRAGIER